MDGSPEGYYQFVVLALLGDQFYLSWHANYNDTKVMCDVSDNKYVNEDIKGYNLPDSSLPQNLLDASQKVDHTPLVFMGDKTVKVCLVTFSKWGGYVDRIYTMGKQNPNVLLTVKENVMVQYHVNILF